MTYITRIHCTLSHSEGISGQAFIRSSRNTINDFYFFLKASYIALAILNQVN